MKLTKTLLASGIVAMSGLAASVQAGEFSGNVAVSNNYIWRGLTQTTDEPAVSGGFDYADDSGWYIGTWASNVQYASDDAFSYEHDIYTGFSADINDTFSYDVGLLYYNYNEEAEFDFAEVYGTIGIADFSATLYVLLWAEPDEEDFVSESGGEADFGVGEAFYLSLDYNIDLGHDWSLGLHGGYHDGDFVQAFNFGDNETFDYFDANVSLSKGGFSFTVSQTDLNNSPQALNNDETKFVVAYSVDI